MIRMLNKKSIIVLISAIMLLGCTDPKPTPKPNSNNKSLGGIQTTISKEERFTPKPIPSYYYGQFFIETKLHPNAIQSSKTLKFKNYLFKIFGNEQKQFGLSITPIINGIKLPNVVLFSYAYNSQHNHWQSDYIPEYISPLIKLDSNTIFSYRLKQHTSNYIQSSLVRKVNNIINDYSAIVPGTWAISAASQPIIKDVSEVADRLIGSLLTQSQQSDLSSVLQPAFTGRKAQTILVTDYEGNPLADIRISIRLTNSLINPQAKEVSSDFMVAIPQMTPFIDPLNTIRVNGKENRTIRQALNGEINHLASLNNPDQFSSMCHQLLNDRLQGEFGLTRFDALNSMRFLLRSTKFSKSRALYESGCLNSEDFELLKRMGVPIKLNEGYLQFDPELYLDIGKLMQSPQNRSRIKHIKRFFSDDISVSTDTSSKHLINGYYPGYAYSKEDIIDLFSGMKVARFCCIRRPVIDGKSLKNGQQMFFRRTKEKTLYSIEFYRGERKPLINHIIIKTVNENEISQNERETLLRSMRDNEYY